MTLLEAINKEQKLFGKQVLEWQSDWFNIANRVARSHAQGVDVESEAALT